VSYINWTFQASFSTVFLSFLATFILWVLVFAAILKWSGETHPGCIIVGGEEFGHNPSTVLADAFTLSWTTFSTVGYGVVSTSTGTEHSDQRECALISIICTLESFLGLIYAATASAILFAKITRIQNHAQVTFSDAICIEYGRKLSQAMCQHLLDDFSSHSHQQPVAEYKSEKAEVSL